MCAPWMAAVSGGGPVTRPRMMSVCWAARGAAEAAIATAAIRRAMRGAFTSQTYGQDRGKVLAPRAQSALAFPAPQPAECGERLPLFLLKGDQGAHRHHALHAVAADEHAIHQPHVKAAHRDQQRRLDE